jgi:hypothetical protein
MEAIEIKYKFDFMNDVDEKKIINLFDCDIIEENDDVNYWHYVGFYYERKIKNYNLMKKYYLMALNRGSWKTVYNLYRHYKLMNAFNLTYDDIEMIIKYNLKNINLNMKITFEYDFINKNYVYLQNYNNNKYIDIINLIYCD